MRRIPSFLLAGLVLASGHATPAAARERAASAPLPERLLRRVAEAKVRDGQLGLCVVALDSGAVVAEVGGTTPLVPASVAKVATAAAALDGLGPGWTWSTTVDARGTFDAATGTLDGDLVVHGSGDPMLSKRNQEGLSKRGREADPLHPLSLLAAAVAERGVKRVTGAVVLDDGPFDRSYLHPTWLASDLDKWYAAPVAGLTFNDGCISVLVRGGVSEGDPARVEAPSTAGPWTLTNATTTEGGKALVGGVWTEGGTRLRVQGSVPAGSATAFDVPAPDPLALFGSAFQAALLASGVVVEGGVKVALSDADRAAGQPIAVVKDELAEALRVMNRRSQNLYASLVFKACGAAREGKGTWESGSRAVADAFERRGVGDPGFLIVDGSGLSRDNRATARALAGVLAAFDRDPVRGPILRDSLAVPGDEEGTLRKRLKSADAKARVRAKTGTLKGVHALVGYVDGREGRAGFAFAAILNGSYADPVGFLDDVVQDLLDE